MKAAVKQTAQTCLDDVRADSRQAESEAGVASVSLLTVKEGSQSRTLINDTAEVLDISFSLLSCKEHQLVCFWLQVAGEHKYHPECFVCLSCKVVIEDRDTYALVERSKLYW